MKTSNTAQTIHLATYKTTAHQRCVNVQFNDDYRFLVIMSCSLLQISRILYGVTFKKAVITHNKLEVSRKQMVYHKGKRGELTVKKQV
jgi:hypothetical protein